MVEFNKAQKSKNIPDFNAGDVVKVFRKIVEGGKERIQMFQGIILAVKGKQSSSPTITVRKVSNGVGVELVLPIYSPMIEKIEIVKRASVRRSKLYFIRDKSAKSLKLKYTDAVNVENLKEEQKDEIVADKEEIIDDAETTKEDLKKNKTQETK